MDAFIIVSCVLFWTLLAVPYVATLTRPGKRGVEWRLDLALCLDVYLNVIFLGRFPDTVSERVGRSAIKGNKTGILLAFFIDILFFILIQQLNHCRNAASKK